MTFSKGWKRISGCVAGLALMTAASAALAADKVPIRLGWVSWSDTEISAKLAAKIIEEKLHRPVKLVMADIGIQFKALINNDIDVIPMVWLPVTHKAYWDKYGSQLEDLGVLYEGRIGWAVPDSVPKDEVSSITDLTKPGIGAKFGYRILTSEPGNGQYILSQKAMQEYGLGDYKLMASSEAGMTTQFGRDVDRDKWAILNAWNPHWMFAKWKMRYLEDPKGLFGGAEQIHIVARKGFKADEPDVARFLANYTLPLADLERLQLEAKASSTEKVISDYYAVHKAHFDSLFDTPQTARITQP